MDRSFSSGCASNARAAAGRAARAAVETGQAIAAKGGHRRQYRRCEAGGVGGERCCDKVVGARFAISVSGQILWLCLSQSAPSAKYGGKEYGHDGMAQTAVPAPSHGSPPEMTKGEPWRYISSRTSVR